jgi:hypothetical protein
MYDLFDSAVVISIRKNKCYVTLIFILALKLMLSRYTVNLVVFFLDKKLPGKAVLQFFVLIFLYTYSLGHH